MKPYSWEDFSNRFGHLSGEIAVYNFSVPEVEHTAPIKKLKTTYDTVFNSNTSSVSYMLKTSNSLLTEYVSPLVEKYKNVDEIVLRVQTNPWRYSTHFDTYDQTIVMLDGVKRWIFFRKTFETLEEEIRFVKHVNGMTFENLQSYLNLQTISYHLNTSRGGDIFFIPMGMYHAVENVNEGPGTIFINVIHHGFDSELEDTFTKLWPTVAKNCDKGVFY
jgi:hypothetical protein